MAYMQDIGGWSSVPAFYGANLRLHHVPLHAAPALDTTHACTEPGCNHYFDDAQSLKDHMTQHTWGPHTIQTAPDGTKTFVCLNCGKGVSDRKVLRKHLLTHQEKRFLCSFDGCDKRFYERAKLKRHMLVHTGEKSFMCTFEGCGKQFAYKANLKTHLRTHTGLKPFACLVPGCNRTFAQASNRNSHMQTHNRSMPLPPSPVASAKAKPQHAHRGSGWPEAKEMMSLMDHVDSVIGHSIMPMTAYKVPVMALPIQELLEGEAASHHHHQQQHQQQPPQQQQYIATPMLSKKVRSKGLDGTIPPLDLSTDGLKSSDLYSMLPTPGSFIDNAVFSFEA
ncbi:hypothetical protein AC1031_000684 [Aphanomyces cochlioides]|nr:hypothetical protein AC1031_000684 [Aphanomyces cochlioides]